MILSILALVCPHPVIDRSDQARTMVVGAEIRADRVQALTGTPCMLLPDYLAMRSTGGILPLRHDGDGHLARILLTRAVSNDALQAVMQEGALAWITGLLDTDDATPATQPTHLALKGGSTSRGHDGCAARPGRAADPRETRSWTAARVGPERDRPLRRG